MSISFPRSNYFILSFNLRLQRLKIFLPQFLLHLHRPSAPGLQQRHHLLFAPHIRVNRRCSAAVVRLQPSSGQRSVMDRREWHRGYLLPSLPLRGKRRRWGIRWVVTATEVAGFSLIASASSPCGNRFWRRGFCRLRRCFGGGGARRRLISGVRTLFLHTQGLVWGTERSLCSKVYTFLCYIYYYYYYYWVSLRCAWVYFFLRATARIVWPPPLEWYTTILSYYAKDT